MSNTSSRAGTGHQMRTAVVVGLKNVTPLLCDVRDKKSVSAAVDNVSSQLGGCTLALLVANAGAPMLSEPFDEIASCVDVNLTGIMRVTLAFAPLLGADLKRTGAPGRILITSSIFGRVAVPFAGAYCATKFGLEGFAASLRQEMRPFGVSVTAVEPGPVATQLTSKAEARADAPKAVDVSKGSAYEASFPRYIDALAMMFKFLGMSAPAVGTMIANAAEARSPPRRLVAARWAMLPMLYMPTRLFDCVWAVGTGLIRRAPRKKAGASASGSREE